MILQALNDYYERMASDPESGISPAGFSRQKISFIVVVNPDGTLHAIEDGRVQSPAGKSIARSLQVCGAAKPSGSGINPGFLWDNTAYMLGFKPEDPKPERTREAFEAFRKRHLAAEKEINDPHFSAVCRCLEAWQPEQAGEHPLLAELATGFGVWQIRGQTEYVHERPAVKSWWLNRLAAATADAEGTAVGPCLVTGQTAVLARLHEPKIKGVNGAQSAGAAIVSFNLEAFESYGKSQSINAPVSQAAAFQYCTALNQLLSERERRRQVGDATVVFWTGAPCPAEDELAALMCGGVVEDEAELSRLRSTVSQIVQGLPLEKLGDPETPCYVLGLSPNVARISVRFWHTSRLADFIDRIREHYTDLQLVHSERDPDILWPWQILRETARESKDIPPLLSGGLMRAILLGQPYPQLLLGALIRRIRADQSIPYARAAAIKACLNRQSRFGIQPLSKELTVALDEERPEPAYQLGRLFAELEKTQQDALPGINDTIKDRYFGAASATPASVFPRLIRLNQHHLGKLDVQGRVYHERRIQGICSRVDRFPGQLNLRDQGLFAIGYYHQRQDIFTKKTPVPSTTSSTPEQE